MNKFFIQEFFFFFLTLRSWAKRTGFVSDYSGKQGQVGVQSLKLLRGREEGHPPR